MPETSTPCDPGPSVLSAPVLTPAGETLLFRLMRPPNSPRTRARARDALIRRNMRLASKEARRGLGVYPFVPFSDLLSYATVAMIEAVDRFDLGRGFKFSTYATHRIRGRLQRFVEDDWPIVHVPQYVQRLLRKLKPEEVEAHEYARAGAAVLRFSGHLEFLSDPASSEDDPASGADDDAEAVRAAVRGLSGREAWVVAMRYGLDGRDGMTLERVGAVMGVSKERVRQIEAVAMEKLTAALSPDGSARGGLRAEKALESAGRLGGGA